LHRKKLNKRKVRHLENEKRNLGDFYRGDDRQQDN